MTTQSERGDGCEICIDGRVQANDGNFICDCKLGGSPMTDTSVDDMKLPEGKTCCDCRYWKRCSSLIDDLDGTETHCDFAPSRFKEVNPL